MAKKGIVTKGPLAVNPKYLSLIDGFEPTDEEIKSSMDILKAEGYVA